MSSEESFELPPMVCFGYHKDCHSGPMSISDDGKEAKKLNPEECYAKGVVYSDRPVKGRVEFEVEVISYGTSWSGNLKLGIMLHKSGKALDHLAIPRYTPEAADHCVWSANKLYDHVTTMSEVSYGGRTLDELRKGDRLGIIITSTGVLHFLVNGKPQGLATRNIYRMGHDVYVVVDHYANCLATKITKAITSDRQQEHHELQKKDRELQETRRELQEKNRELKEKDRKLQEKDRELQESRDAVRIYQQQVLTDDHWVIDKDEVIVTGVELGRGSYATVNIGVFRGLNVAVKSLHNMIISDYNLALFSREMSIASRVRHPNLVQFIGATKVGNPLILIELMSTSLHKELQKSRLTKQQILGIAQDVALGLNYLHLFKPHPIIHRDVSSPNVLLKPCTGPAGYEAKVTDYGTANLQETTSTIMPGNAAYAAPEAPNPERHTPAMDVYSYSVLLMEMTLHLPPEMTIAKREQQAGSISWPSMKSLVQGGLNAGARPTMAQVINQLKNMKI